MCIRRTPHQGNSLSYTLGIGTVSNNLIIIIIMIIITGFYIALFHLRSKCFTVYLLPRSLDSASILHSQCTFSTPWGAFGPSPFYRHAQTNSTTIPFASYRVPIYTWVESSNVDKVSAVGQKYWVTVGIKPGLSAWESSGHTTIPRHLHSTAFHGCFHGW